MYAELRQIVCEDCRNVSSVRFYKTAKKCQNCAKQAWKKKKAKARAKNRKQNPDKHKIKDFEADLMKNYGITIQKYQQMLVEQKGCCAICGKHESSFKRRLHIDHDHTTGQVRALLCTRCNPGLGYFEDSVEKLEMAITYLNKFKKLG
jgi:hypothetical protein